MPEAGFNVPSLIEKIIHGHNVAHAGPEIQTIVAGMKNVAAHPQRIVAQKFMTRYFFCVQIRVRFHARAQILPELSDAAVGLQLIDDAVEYKMH